MKPLKIARERHGLTQAELAERLGTTQQTIARWEAGKAEPNLAMLRDLAICLYTSVDDLLGRKPILERQTTNPFSRFSGDKSGYWGNIGIRLPSREFSIWYPITTSTMERVFSELQNAGRNAYISFQTLNNKMVICRPSHFQALTFLDEAEDEVEGDWEVGPDDVEGWPQEIYECLEYLMWEQMGAPRDEGQFSDKLISATQETIEQYRLSEKDMMRMCVCTNIIYTDGTNRFIHASSEKLADSMFELDQNSEDSGLTMLHLDDEYGDHSVFLSLILISLIEFPLLSLKKGMEKQMEEHAL